MTNGFSAKCNYMPYDNNGSECQALTNLYLRATYAEAEVIQLRRENEALEKVAKAAKQLMALSIVLDAHPWLPWPALRAALDALEADDE